MELIKELFTIHNPVAKFYNKALATGYDDGYTKGFKSGQKEGFDIGFSKGEEQGETIGYENAINEINEYIDKEKNNKNTDALYNTLDGVMLWMRSIIEIKDTSFFKNIYFINTSSKVIMSYINFLSDIEDNFESAKLLYPEVCYWLDDLMKIFQQIYDNKLAVEEVERMF